LLRLGKFEWWDSLLNMAWNGGGFKALGRHLISPN